jgi:hypothetical protein
MASHVPPERLPDDPFAGERFIRVVGRRRRPEIGQVPSPATRAAADALLSRARMGGPKGVFVYRSHEEANADRERWLIDAMLGKDR